ncbi:alpha/beta-hydrolase [Exidia glandulosa HHB12029]|uniref:Alpha/beta-hydrolase n=1 Tax=Exidia glandulosa HHB12029 TaxID=1314781 RepID=A0A166AI71_EXIGL|nr:alpha/beta-hydrolase [Exidia glandulosa HHB12029]
MHTSFVSLSALLSAALGAATPREAPRCIESLIPITASATNFDLSSGSAPPNATIPVSGTFPIQLRLCAPTTPASLRSKTLQVLIPGATFNTDYWDMSFEPETYNYVRFAAANGYWTLNMARLGDGGSARPDGNTIVQIPFGVAVVSEIVKLARAGSLFGTLGGIEKVVVIGHSLGAVILNGVVETVPSSIDGAVFAGFSHTFGPTNVAVAEWGPASEIVPERFAGLPPAYLTSLNATTRAAALYGAPGTFDPAALEWDEERKDTIANGELLTFAGAVPVAAPSFTGDVFMINGDQDGVFCSKPGCANLADEAQFYAGARSVEFNVISGVGHCLNLQFGAPKVYAAIQEWLNKHGY